MKELGRRHERLVSAIDMNLRRRRPMRVRMMRESFLEMVAIVAVMTPSERMLSLSVFSLCLFFYSLFLPSFLI